MSGAPVLVFDIETVPDVAGIRRIHDIGADVDDAGVVAWFSQRRRATAGTDFAPIYLQQVVAIGCALRDPAGLRIWSIGEPGDPEPELIRRFFDGIEKYTPQLVSWNGSGFDLPVLNHRAVIHGIRASRYWDWGDEDREFRFNNYLARFHTRHLDVMDVAAEQQSFGDHAMRRFNEAIKDAVDPAGILAPGKQGIWPAAMRPAGRSSSRDGGPLVD